MKILTAFVFDGDYIKIRFKANNHEGGIYQSCINQYSRIKIHGGQA